MNIYYYELPDSGPDILKWATFFVAFFAVLATFLGHYLSVRNTKSQLKSTSENILKEVKANYTADIQKELLDITAELIAIIKQVTNNYSGGYDLKELIFKYDTILNKFELRTTLKDRDIINEYKNLKRKHLLKSNEPDLYNVKIDNVIEITRNFIDNYGK